MKTSLVIPLYNENEVIDELIPRTLLALEKFCYDFELIIIDDGSNDGSLEKLIAYQQASKHLKIIVLSRNFGHQAAFSVGLEHARGEFVAMMDGDLQDPPEVLEEMFNLLESGQYDVIDGVRRGRKGKKIKMGFVNLFHRLFKCMTKLDNLTNAGNFCMMNRKALAALLSMNERVRYLPGLRNFIGFRRGSVVYVREDRFKGKPKMTFLKLFILAADAVFSFSRLPIRICLVLGIIGAIVFMLAGIYVLIAKIAGFAVLGWSSTILSIYFLGSIQLIFLGVVGEYVYRIYKESQKRPLYFIKDIYETNNKN